MLYIDTQLWVHCNAMQCIVLRERLWRRVFKNKFSTKGMGKVFHPGMPNTPKGDDYPKSWNEKVFNWQLISNYSIQARTTLNYLSDISHKFHRWPQQLVESLHWGGNGGNHSEVNMKSQNVALALPVERKFTGTLLKSEQHKHLKILDRDIANTDYTIEKLRELAPAALIGEKNFFIAYGLHKVTWVWSTAFNQCVSSSASPAMGLPCRILRSLPWGRCWSARQSLCSRGEKYWKLSERSTNRCSGLPGRGLGSSNRRFELPWLFSRGPGHSWSRLAKCPSIFLRFIAI